MNKILLSFGAAMLALSSFAQTNSITSGNMPVNNDQGYEFNFNGNGVDNCSGGFLSKVPNDVNLHAGITVTSVGDGKLKVTTNGNAVNWGSLDLRLSSGNCSDYNFDMSRKVSQRIEIKIKSSVELKEFKILLVDRDGAANDSSTGGFNLKANVDTVLIYETVDFHQWVTTDLVNSSQITNVLLYFRDNYATQVAGTFEIDYIKLGNTNAVVGLTNKAKESSVSIFPNPASTSVNFEKELQNVTIYNIVGTQVYQAAAATTVDVSSFQAGVYYLQHAEGTSRFTVQ